MITPRKAARVLIIENQRVMVCHNQDALGDWYLLPGGGSLPGETLEGTAIRECQEELGIGIQILGPICTHEVSWPIGSIPRFTRDSPVHQVERIFLGVVFQGRPGTVVKGDHAQVGATWLPLAGLQEIDFYPRALVPFLVRGSLDEIPPYLLDQM